MSRVVRVTLNGTLVAESSETKSVEGNFYFPPDSLVKEHFSPSDTTTRCGWKGDASYYTVCGLKDAAWYYPTPLEKAKEIENHVAFYKNKVSIEETAEA